jgi:hypothetical protein
MTRLQTLREKGLQPDLPSAGLAAYLVDYLFEAGPVVSNAMGAQPLGWPDLAAWQQGTGIELQPWEARALRHLSTVYLASAQAAQAHDCPPPWSCDPDPDRRDLIGNALKNIFQGLRKH